MSNIERFRDAMLKGAIINLNTSGYIAPVAFIYTDDRQVAALMPQKLEDEQDKDQWVEQIRSIVPRVKARAVMMITEAWILQLPEDHTGRIPTRISKHPDRKEIISATLETRSGDIFMYQAEIFRPAGGPPTAGPFQGGKAPVLEGRFSRFFPSRDTRFS